MAALVDSGEGRTPERPPLPVYANQSIGVSK
jgi:hypothetical protein